MYSYAKLWSSHLAESSSTAMRKAMIQNLGNPTMQKGVRIAHIVLVAIMIMYRKLEAGIGLLYGQTNRNTSHLPESSSTARGGRQWAEIFAINCRKVHQWSLTSSLYYVSETWCWGHRTSLLVTEIRLTCRKRSREKHHSQKHQHNFWIQSSTKGGNHIVGLIYYNIRMREIFQSYVNVIMIEFTARSGAATRLVTVKSLEPS